jgi:glycosyltransferase involved in cell wall biosynthesis
VENLNIVEIAPPWLAIPPPKYGGTELVVDALSRALDRAGHTVTLFTIAPSTCPVARRWRFGEPTPHMMGNVVDELRQVLWAYDQITSGDVPRPDVIHDHTLTGLFIGPQRTAVPIVATVHGPFDSPLADIYPHVDPTTSVVAISHDQAAHAPPGVRIAATIHHGIEIDRYPYADHTGDGVVFLGRMSPDKGVESAIRIARSAGRSLRIAAKMHEAGEYAYFHHVIEPLLDGGVEYVGEADFATKVELLSTSAALLNPISWPEPFGLAMVEAMACGTPVVGGAFGAAPEIVAHGRTGFLGRDEGALVDGLLRVDTLDRRTCRAAVESHFTSDRMAADYASLFARLAGRVQPAAPTPNVGARPSTSIPGRATKCRSALSIA